MRKWISYASSSNWLRVVGVATILLLGAYAMVQQSTRLSVNDAPLAEAQTIKHRLEAGEPAKSVIPPVDTNLRTDSTIFAIVTDDSYMVLASSAKLDGGATLPPVGTFQAAKADGNNWFTWQPRDNVRLATEIIKYNSGYIVTGQSLAQAESRISTYGWITLATWTAIVIWATFIPVPSLRKK